MNLLRRGTQSELVPLTELPNGQDMEAFLGVTLTKGDEAGLVYCDIDLKKCKESRQARPYITLRRPEFYR